MGREKCMDEITRVYIRALLVTMCILMLAYGAAYKCFAAEVRDSGPGWSESDEGSGGKDEESEGVFDSGVPGDVPNLARDVHAIRQYWEFTLYGIIPVTVSVIAVIAGFVWFRKVFIRL